jgi:transcription antitermination protein NusB
MAAPREYRAWELALGLLFEVDIAGTPLKDAVDASEELRISESDVRDAAVQMAIRVAGNRNRVETLLKSGVKHYELSRVPGVERSILRLAATELILGTDSPKVIIDCAARLARKFGGADSDRFVVGVLKGLPAGGGPTPGEGQPLGDESH